MRSQEQAKQGDTEQSPPRPHSARSGQELIELTGLLRPARGHVVVPNHPIVPPHHHHLFRHSPGPTAAKNRTDRHKFRFVRRGDETEEGDLALERRRERERAGLVCSCWDAGGSEVGREGCFSWDRALCFERRGRSRGEESGCGGECGRLRWGTGAGIGIARSSGGDLYSTVPYGF